MPPGIKMSNVVPKVVSLEDRKRKTERTTDEEEDMTIKHRNSEQYSLPLQAAYFLFVGGWASAVWIFFAWLASITVIGLPLAAWMYDRPPFIVSLYQY